MKKTLFLMATVALMVASCGDNKKPEEAGQTTEQPAATEAPAADQAAEAVNVTLEGTDQMTFNIQEIKAKAGQTINVTLKHVGQMPKNQMGHNFVLLKKGTDIPTFGMDAMKAGLEKDYIPNNGADVIAHTKLIGGGETDTISFKAPEPGTYDYICSYPGHFSLMKGKLIVE